MKWILATVVLLFALTMVAQQMEDQSSSPDTMSAAEQLQPNSSNGAVLHEIQSRLSTSSELNNTQISTTVSGDSVILSGYVDGREQRSAAEGIAEQFSDGRSIVDNIQVGGTPGEGF